MGPAQQMPPAMSQGYWQNPFPDNFGDDANIQQNVQDQIVNERSDSVAQFFGQVTPPDTDAKPNQADASQQLQASDAAKRKERARNAANKRHAKSKKARTGSESQGGDEDMGEDRGEKQAHYREKNRVAAAKCRAKKKNHNDNLEEMHRGEASKNKILKAELMGLRNELAQLKGLTLEHSPDSCQCHGIHEYSMRQANLIARGAAPQYGASLTSPTQDSPLSMDTPASDIPDDGVSSMNEQMSPAMGSMSRRTSSFAPGKWMPPS